MRPITQILTYEVESDAVKLGGGTRRVKKPAILALCSDGTLWCNETGGWTQIEGPPSPLNAVK